MGSSSNRRAPVPRLALATLAILLIALPLTWTLGPAERVRERFDLGIGDRDPLLTVAPCEADRATVRSPEGPQAAAGAWRSHGRSPFGRDELRAAMLGGRAYVVGGHRRVGGERPWRSWSRGALLIWDLRNGGFQRGPELPQPVDHPAVVAHDGAIYVAGGFTNGRATDALWRYSPRRRSWTRLEPMPTRRGALDAAVTGGRLYAIGGSDQAFPGYEPPGYRTVESYDFETHRWQGEPDMPTPRHHLDVAELGGRIHATGGRHRLEFSLDSHERFDPATGEWTELPALPQGVASHAAVASGDEVVVFGGSDDRAHWITGASWAYSPKSGDWRRLPDMGQARHAHASVAHQGRVYAIEGAPCPGFGQMSSIESLAVR